MRVYGRAVRCVLPVHDEAMRALAERPAAVLRVPWGRVLAVPGARAPVSGTVPAVPRAAVFATVSSVRQGIPTSSRTAQHLPVRGYPVLPAQPLQAVPLLLLPRARLLHP
ncbi:uncharacterized protein LOC125225573 isoform X2 [Leguminivora glycinivorella]|uniref:uncharacterized protein LOC125225573 isoform X2 n=1 Tax=Leguminivora glycinivorella TaxID=1035111 RepID=UPI00200BA346|nr:uncharacterized protein LOC125225573 isoform X2 [Leguminivora glycinivorella]